MSLISLKVTLLNKKISHQNANTRSSGIIAAVQASEADNDNLSI